MAWRRDNLLPARWQLHLRPDDNLTYGVQAPGVVDPDTPKKEGFGLEQHDKQPRCSRKEFSKDREIGPSLLHLGWVRPG